MDNSAKKFFRDLAIGITILVSLVIFTVVMGVKENFEKEKEEDIKISNFKECVEAGNPVMESFPRQCRTGDGQHFVEDMEDLFLQE